MNSGRFRNLSALVNVFLLKIWRPFSPLSKPTAALQVPVGCHYPASRFLPLARRRLIIRRPCLVDIRFRNPWFRARRRLLG